MKRVTAWFVHTNLKRETSKMNARRTAIALAIIGLLATTISAQAALVWSDNFDSYALHSGYSWGNLEWQSSWVQGINGVDFISDPTGNGRGNVLRLGLSPYGGNDEDHTTLPPSSECTCRTKPSAAAARGAKAGLSSQVGNAVMISGTGAMRLRIASTHRR